MTSAQKIGTAALLVLGGAMVGCFPKRLSSKCEQEMSDCLRRCPTQVNMVGVTKNSVADTRTPCEQACQNLCR